MIFAGLILFIACAILMPRKGTPEYDRPWANCAAIIGLISFVTMIIGLVTLSLRYLP